MQTLTKPQLTAQQQTLKKQCLLWLSRPNSEDKFRVIRGFAGSGKTFVIKSILSDFQPTLDYSQHRANLEEFKDKTQQFLQGFLSYPPTPPKGLIAGCAPTHKAKKVLKDSAGQVLDNCSTVQSFFSLRLSQVKFTAQDEKRLATLQSNPGLTTEQDTEREALLLRQKAAQDKKRELVPTDRLDLTGVRLIIIDECSMLGEFLLKQILAAAYHETASEDLQIIFMGDPFQLPPVGEVLTKTFQLPAFPELTEIVRYQGKILEYATAIRERPSNLQGLHFQFTDQSEDLAQIDFRSAIVEGSDMIAQGEDLMFVAATNNAVDLLNQAIRTQIKGSDLDFCVGDRLLTRQAVERRSCLVGRVPHCVRYGRGSYCTSCNFEDCEIGTSTFLTIREILSREVYVTPIGTPLRLTKALVDDYDLKIPYKTEVYLCHPEDVSLWASDIQKLQNRVSSFFSRAKGKTRGETGLKAQEVWQLYNLKNWNTKANGEPLSESEYNAIRSECFRHLNECKEYFDDITLAYAATVNRMQGATVDVVAIHTESIFQALRYSQNKPSSWDPHRLLYTAVTRAAKQLVLF